MARQRWLSAVARALAREEGVASPTTAMVQRATRLLEEAGAATVPVNLRLLASFQRVADIETVAMSSAGRLVPRGQNVIIQVNARHNVGKQHFTVCHEIGHTLLPSRRDAREVIDDPITGAFDDTQEEEYLCDIAASELLMPMSVFRPMAASSGLGMASVVDLARSFGSSREATAIRMVQSDLWPSAMAMWHYAYKPSQEGMSAIQPQLLGMDWQAPEKKLRVRYAVHNAAFGYFLHKHLSAEAEGYLMRCFREGVTVAGREIIEIGGRLVPLQVSAMAIDFVGPQGAAREVLSILSASHGAATASISQPSLWDASSSRIRE